MNKQASTSGTTFFSVLIPTYNGSRYLRECLDSVVLQTYRNFECIIVDDCSTDDTYTIVQQYAEQHAFFRIYKNEKNVGLVQNWQRCIALANGDWLKFLFQDDLLAPDCLAVFDNHIPFGSLFMVAQRNFIIESDAPPHIAHYFTHQVATLQSLLPETMLISPAQMAAFAYRHFLDNFIGEPTAVCLHKSIFDKIGTFNLFLKQIVDYEFWLRIGLNTSTLYIAAPLASFRVHSSATTARNNNNTALVNPAFFDSAILYHEYTFFRNKQKTSSNMGCNKTALSTYRQISPTQMAYLATL